MLNSIFDHYHAQSAGFYLKGIIRSITDGSYHLDTGRRIKLSKTLIRYPVRLLTTFSMFTIQCPIVPVSRGNSDLSWRANWLDIDVCIKFSHPTTSKLVPFGTNNRILSSSVRHIKHPSQSPQSFAQNSSSQFFFDFCSNLFMLIWMGCINQKGVVWDNETNINKFLLTCLP